MEQRNGIQILLNTIALEPNRWTAQKIPHFRLLDLLPRIADHRFEALEVWQHHVDRLQRNELHKVASFLDVLGITTPVLGIYPKIHLDGQDGRRELSNIDRLLDVAALLGCDIVKMFVGSVGSGRLTDVERDRSLTFLREALQMAVRRGIRLTGETHADTLFDTVASTLRTLERLDAPNFGVCFQPYDASLTGATGAFTALRERIWHLHFQGRRNGAISLLEEADLDYAAYSRFIAESNFEGYLCIEFVKDCVVASPEMLDVEKVLANAEADREFIRKHLG